MLEILAVLQINLMIHRIILFSVTPIPALKLHQIKGNY